MSDLIGEIDALLASAEIPTHYDMQLLRKCREALRPVEDEYQCQCNYHKGMGPNLLCPVHGKREDLHRRVAKLQSQLAEAKDEIKRVRAWAKTEQDKCGEWMATEQKAQAQIAEYDKEMETASLGQWWDGTEPLEVRRLESWLRCALTRIRQMGEK